jgi:cytochrome c peroxidase
MGDVSVRAGRVRCALLLLAAVVVGAASGARAARPRGTPAHADDEDAGGGKPSALDRRLDRMLEQAGFTGRIESTLAARLGRPLDPALADVGRLLFFDKVLGLHDDNSCAGCHSPAFGFGDSQPMAIGVENNDVVGPGRKGPRNQRRSPLVIDAIFYPALMWTPRFVALSGDPFDASLGFQFPPPERVITGVPTLLAAQGSLPSTELVEMAGFRGIANNPGPFGPRHFVFDDGKGSVLPPCDENNVHNFPIQHVVDERLNAIPEYRERFGAVFNGGTPLPPGGITIDMRRLAIAEFETSLVAADAPLDRFARGDHDAMTRREKRGALLFFGTAKCVACHAVAGPANEMFSDFQAHRIGGPQVAPRFGAGTGDVIFDGPAENEDFGFEQTEGDPAQRYKFRTAPLRNLKVAPAFFHNGAFGTLEAAIRHHLDVERSLRTYDPAAHGVPADLTAGPFAGMLQAGIDPLVARRRKLSRQQVRLLVEFVRDGLFDDRVLDFCKHIPTSVPSGMPLQTFEGCD